MTADLTVDAVKTTDGVSVAKSVKSVKFFDVTAPTVSNVSVSAPGVITVSFSEPLASVPTFKVDGGLVAITNTPALSADGKSVSLNLGVANEGAHTVTVSGGTDFAGYTIESVEKAFTYAKDTAAPTFTVSSVSETQLVLQFNEAITNASDANVVFSHTYKGTYNDTRASRQLSADGKTLTLTFANPIPNGTVNFYLGYTSATGTQIQDAWGNKVAEATFTANVVSDTVAPTVSKIETVSNTSIEVTYSEAVIGAATAANYTLKDSEGNAVPFTVSPVSGNKYAVNPTAPLNGGDYTLTIKNVTDSSFNTNKLVDYSTVVAVADKVAPTIVDVNTATAGTTDVQLLTTKKVKIKFSEAMNVATITNKNNYAFGGAALDSDVTLTAVDGNKAVVLDFTNATTVAQQTPAGAVITVGRVADAAGNYTAAFSQTVTVQGTVSAPLFKQAEVVGANTVKFLFDEVITGLAASDFLISADNGTNYNAATSIAVSVVDGKTVVTATTSATLPSTAANVVVKTAVTPSGKNAYDAPISIANNTATVDKYAPMATTATAVDQDGNTFVDRFTVQFSENLYVASVQDSDFTVEGYEVTGVSVNNGTVTLTVKEKTVNDLAATPKVTLVGSVEDNDRNARASQGALTAVAAQVASDAAAQAAVDAEAAAVANTFAPTGAVNTIVLPTVSAGYTIAVKTTSDATTYSATGELLADGTSNVVYTVTHTASGKTQDTATVAVTVDVTP
jgi:trimeric autotransporter adhesin